MKTWVLPVLVVLWLGGLGGGFLLVGREPGIAHPLAAAQGTTSTTSATPTAGAPTATETQGQEAEPQGPPQATIRIGLKDFKLVPDKVTGKTGTVTFVLTNEGRYTHDFRVEGQGIDERAPRVGQGHTREWQVTVKPGNYRISCPISNHAKRGMTGTFVVAG